MGMVPGTIMVVDDTGITQPITQPAPSLNQNNLIPSEAGVCPAWKDRDDFNCPIISGR
jgi:hypothetical protein